MNPCPCGHAGSRLKACRCTPDAVARYQGRLSGPLLDRIDLQVEVPAVAPDVLAAVADGEPVAAVAERAAVARARAAQRQGCPNAALDSAALDRHVELEAAAADFLRSAATRLGWSGRSQHRALRVARTIADLAGAERIASAHVAEAMQYRRVLAAA